MRLSIKATALAIILALTAVWFGGVNTAGAVGTFENAVIADYAVNNYPEGVTGGQCRTFVNNVVYLATEGAVNVAMGHPDYFKGFVDAGAVRITSVSELKKGDIVQFGQTEAYAGLHTLIIIGHVSGSSFNVIDSNHNSDEKVDIYTKSIALDDNIRAYRLGTVTSAPALDTYDDLVVLHGLGASGASGINTHVLWGSANTSFASDNMMRNLPGTAGWNWSQVKTASGDFNGGGQDDIVLVHQTGGGGADVHILYGEGDTVFSHAATFARSLPGASGWNWSLMKLAAGKFNGDAYADLAIVHQTGGGGADVHVLWGSSGIPLTTNTMVRSLPGASGWNWSLMKLATSSFNGDSYDDIVIAHQTGGGGADLHVLFGAGASPFQNVATIMRSLPGASGWNWSLMKLAAGKFNGDAAADLTILHGLGAGGVGGLDAHVFWGGASPFSTNNMMRNMPASSGWDWTKIKYAAGDFNGDTYKDIALLHKTGAGTDIHILLGSGASPFINPVTYSRSLLAASGWNWDLMQPENMVN